MKSETLAWIEDQKPGLVKAAEKYVEGYEIYKPGRAPKKPRVSGSQLRNLMAAAQAENSLAVLVNYLRYQIGRGRKGWPDSRSGEAMIELLKTEIGGGIEKTGADGRDRYRLESRLTALLVGYVIREFTFCCKQAGTSSDD